MLSYTSLALFNIEETIHTILQMLEIVQFVGKYYLQCEDTHIETIQVNLGGGGEGGGRGGGVSLTVSRKGRSQERHCSWEHNSP